MTAARTRRRPGLSSEDKIVIMISVFERGGAERQAFLLARELRNRHGLNAEVWALTHPGSYGQEFEAAGIPIRVLYFNPPDYARVRLKHAPRMGRRLLRVAGQLREGRVDILLPFTTWPNVVAGMTYRLAGVRLCIWGERHCGAERVPGLEGLAVRQYPQFVANSSAGVDFLATEMGVRRERIGLIPNGVEEREVVSAQDWRARLGLTPGQRLVVKVANVSQFKDHPTLLQAWKIVQDSWPGAERPVLALPGAHANRYEECLQIVREAGLTDTVHFLGSIPDVPALLAACDLTVFSSRWEGMPNGVLECMAAGKAVVASDLPGVRDALGADARDVLIPPGDVAGFARKLLDLLLIDSCRAALGAANLHRIRTEFSVPRMADRHLHAIRSGLSPDDTGASAPFRQQEPLRA